MGWLRRRRVHLSGLDLFRWLRDVEPDVRHAIRTLCRSPGFTAVAVLTLAVGIGATTAISSVVDTILLQPLPFADAERLVRVVENVPSSVAGRPPIQRGVTHQEFLEWRARTRTLSEAAAVTSLGQRTVRTRDGTARLWGGMTSGNTFTLLGARPVLGRLLGPGDEADPNVVVLGFDTWRRLFHADPGVVGTTIALHPPETMFQGGASPEARLLTVVGVLPAVFELPAGPIDS